MATPGPAWQQPGGESTLVRGVIHLWRADLDKQALFCDQFAEVLSEEERARASRLHLERDRLRSIARRGLLRIILDHYLHVGPARMRFAYGPCGKPALLFPAGTNLQFNLAHSDGLALYAVTRDGAVGVDVERIRVIPQAEEIIARWFAAGEAAEWNALPRSRQAEGFLKCWTRLEACVKASGQGVAEALVQVQGSAPRSRSSAPASAARRAQPQGDCVICHLTPARGYVAALACHALAGAPSKKARVSH